MATDIPKLKTYITKLSEIYDTYRPWEVECAECIETLADMCMTNQPATKKQQHEYDVAVAWAKNLLETHQNHMFASHMRIGVDKPA